MAGRIQDSDVKNATETGAASRLINDTKIYVTGSSLNKTLFQAIDDGDLGSGSGGGLTPTAVKTANYTAVNGDLVLCDATSGGFTITFPAGSAGARIGVKKIRTDTTFNQVTIDGDGSETISGATTKKLNTFDEYQEFVWSTGLSDWVRVIHYWSPAVTTISTISITATSNPTKGTTTIDRIRWIRTSGGIWKASFQYSQNAASGGGGSGNYNYNFPSGLTADTNFIPARGVDIDGRDNEEQSSCLGYGHVGVDGSSRGNLVAFLRSSTSIQCIGEVAYSVYSPIGSSNYGMTNANLGYSFTVDVKMVDWD